MTEQREKRNLARSGTARSPITQALVDLVLPLGAFYGSRALGVGTYLALVVSAVVPATVALTALVRRRRVDGTAVFVLIVMALTVLVSLLSHSPRLLLLREAGVTGVAGVWFIGSAWSRSPLAYRYSRPIMQRWFGPQGRDWDGLYNHLPAFRRMWRTSTVMWGLGLCGDAVIRVVIACMLPIDEVPAVGAALMVAMSVLLIVATSVMYFRAGLFDAGSDLFVERDAALPNCPAVPPSPSRPADGRPTNRR